MCGRYAFTADTEEVKHHFHIHADMPAVTPSVEIFPSESIPVVGLRQGGADFGLTLMRWDYVPWWAKQPKPLINAKSEAVASLVCCLQPNQATCGTPRRANSRAN